MKQTRTTLKELTAMYRAVLRHGILCNAIALGLIATAPAMANNDPNTTGNAWVFGDIVLANAPVRQATIGGRRINNWDGDKYQNDIPAYNMVGQSLSVTNSNMYVGPVSLELRAIDAANDTFAYNYQWDTDGDNINNDVDLANWAGVGWNEDYTNEEHTGVYDKVAAKINSEGGYDNANDTAPGVYMFSRLDTTHANAGKMSFDGSTVTVNGTTVNADSISVTNGSQLTFTKETTLSLEDFNGGNIDSDGKTTLNAGTINIDSSRMVVKNGAELNINATNGATFANGSSNDDAGGAILNEGTLTLDGAAFTNNSAYYGGGAIENLGTLTISNSSFGGTGETDGNNAYYGGALDNYNGIVTLNKSTFTGNSANAEGGAVAAWGGSLTIENETSFVNNKQTVTKAQDDYAAGGGAVFVSDAHLSVSDANFTGNTAAQDGGALYKAGAGNTSVKDSVFTANVATAEASLGGAVVIQQSNTGTVLFDNVTFGDGTATGANHADEAGAIWLGTAGTIENSTFNYNTARNGGAVVTGGSGQLTLNNSAFLNNVADGNGGAIATRPKSSAGTSFLHITGDGTDATMFSNNSAANGGAIYTGTTDTTIADTKFVGNSATTSGGAVYNEGTLSLTDSVFGDKDSSSQLLRNIAENGGAIYNTGDLTVNGGAFYNNTANANTAETSGGGAIYNLGTLTTNSDFIGSRILNTDTGRGGAIWNKGDLTVTGGTYVGNISGVRGGAINISDGTVSIKNTTFGGDSFALRNTANNGGAIAMNKGTVSVTDTTIKNNYASSAGGAIYNNKGTLNITGGTFTGNTANERGGAIFDNKGSLTLTNSVIENNSTAGYGAGIYNSAGTITLTDTVVKDNVIDTVRDTDDKVKGKGAGIYNAESGEVTVNATNKDVTFSGNKVKVDDGTIYEDDIYNRGSLTLNAAANRTLALDGGIDGNGSGIMVVNEDVANTGVVKVAGTLNGQDVTVKHGELHLIDNDPVLVENPGAYLAGSTINVASGAIINTIDDAIQDLSSVVTLADGAGIKGDIDWNNGSADKYASAAGTVKYYVGNLLNGNIGKGEKAFQVVSDGTTVDIAEAKFTSDTGATFLSSGMADGQMIVRGFAGGINTAVETTDADGARLALNYTVTENEVFNSDDSIDNSDFRITGTGADGLAIELQKDLNVSENAQLSLNDVKFTGSSDIVNKAGATLNIKDSFIGVNVNNFGVLKSDPTTYAGMVNNAAGATAEFDNDTFGATATLANAGTVDLKNGVTFVSGASITGAGTTNLVSGTTVFNDTANTNNVFVANGAGFSGSLIGGALNTQNGAIDSGLGTIKNADLYVDASLAGTGSIDSFAGATGSTIKSINLTASEYGTSDSLSLNVGDATVASDVQITGAMNYYTKVAQDGTNLVFSDKLLNESTLYNKLGAWSGGKYIKTSSNMTNAADGATYLNVGQALSALDTAIGDMSGFGSQNYAKNTGSVAANITALDSQLKTVSTEGTIASGNTGFVSGGAVYTALADKVDTTRTINGHALNADVTLGASDVLTSAQQNAVNSGIDTTKVAQIETNTTNISSNTSSIATINLTLGALGTTANTNLADAFSGSTDADIATWAGTNSGKVANVGTTFAVLSAKLSNVENDLLNGDGSNAHSIAHALGATGTTTLVQQVQNLADAQVAANAAAATYDAGGSYASGTIGAAISGNTSAINLLNADASTTGSVDNKIATALGTVETNVTNAWNHAEAWMNTALGIDSTANDADAALQAALGTTNYLGGDTSFSGALKTLDGQAKINADAIATNATNIAANKDAIDVLNGDETTVGSVDYKIAGALSTVEAGVTAVYNQAHDWAENLLGVDVDENVNNQLQNALTSKEVIGSTTTIAGALSNLDAGVDALQNVVGNAQTTAATTGILSGEKIGDTVSLVDAVNTIATTAAGTDADNTFTGTNTFEKQIVAEKGVKFGADYSIDENGAATLASVTAANGFTVDANNTLTSTGLTAAAAAITGNATVGGTLGVTGALSGSSATFTGAVSADSLSATNGVSAKTLSATDSITLGSNTVTSIDTAGLARGVAGNTGVLAATSSVVATIKNQAEDATYTNTISSGSNVSGATLNAAIANLDATIGDMSGLNARDDANSVGNALANGGTTTPTTVVAALNNIDATLGTIHGLKDKLETAGTYKGNLATGTTVEQHLTAIDSAIGDRSSLASLNTAINNAAKTDVATALETTGNLIGNMAFDGTNYLASVTDLSEAVRVLDSNIAKVDHKVEKLERKVNSGMASMAALTALVPNARDCGDTQVSIGTGAYADRAGIAMGAFHYFNDHVLLNAGASYGGTGDWAFRAGITFGL